MNTIIFLLFAVPSVPALNLPGMPGSSVAISTSTPIMSSAPVQIPNPADTKSPVLLPPKVPERPKATLETAGEVSRDLAVRMEYLENGQSYYRAYTKGSHTTEENKAFVEFLADYENELSIAKRTYAILGLWLEKKAALKP